MQTRWARFISLALFLMTAVSARAAVNETFENTGDITGNFIQTVGGTTTTTGYSNVSTAPTIGTNSVEANGDATATYSAGSFTLGSGYQITASVYVAQIASTAGTTVLIETGFGDSNTDVFNNGTSGHLSIYSRLYSIQNQSQNYQFLADNKSSTTNVASQDTENSSVTLNGTSGTPIWYLLSVTLQNLGSNNFQELGTLQHIGANGSSPPDSTVASFSQAWTNSGLATDAATGIYSGFRSVLSGGALRVDNFAVSDPTPIPQPANIAMLAISGIILMRRRRGVVINSFHIHSSRSSRPIII